MVCMFEGSVVGIFVAPTAGAPMEARDEIEAIAGIGLAGDRRVAGRLARGPPVPVG